MNRYEVSTPRAPMMIAAVAMMALTLGLSILPATRGPDGREARLEAAAGAGAPAAAGVADDGAPVVVYGVREQTTAFQPVRHNLQTRKQAG